MTIDFVGKISPQACDLEEAVLGALMIDSDAIDMISNIIKPESFYKDSHQKIFRAILELEKKQEPVDLLTVSESLKKSDSLENIGGPYYLVQLTSKVASASNIEFHARIIAQKHIQRELIRISSEINNKAFDESIDVDDLISFASNSIEQVSNISIEGGDDCSWPELLELTAKQAEKREVLRKEGKTLGIKTPLKVLDQRTGGWRGGDLIIIGARPSAGKTAISIAIMKEDAKNGGCPNFYSLETTKIKIADRILAGEAGVNYENYTMGYMTDQEWRMLSDAQYKLSKYKIIIDDKYNTSIDYIKRKSRMLKKKGMCSMIIIDFLQLAQEENVGKMIREQQVALMSRKCKLMAKELDVPVFILSQLSREVEKMPMKRPTASTLRESGSLEQDADIVILIYRPEQYGYMEDENGISTKGIGELIIEKNKEGGLGSVFFKYNESLTVISDPDPIPSYRETSTKPPTDYHPDRKLEPNHDFDSETPF